MLLIPKESKKQASMHLCHSSLYPSQIPMQMCGSNAFGTFIFGLNSKFSNHNYIYEKSLLLGMYGESFVEKSWVVLFYTRTVTGLYKSVSFCICYGSTDLECKG